MEAYTISSIQQIGVGTVDFNRSWDWFIKMFGFDVKILEDDTVAERMLPYTGGQAQKRHACIAVNLQGGGGLEIWQYSERKPRPADFEISVGDLGVFAAKIKCRDVETFHRELCSSWDACTPLSQENASTRSGVRDRTVPEASEAEARTAPEGYSSFISIPPDQDGYPYKA